MPQSDPSSDESYMSFEDAFVRLESLVQGMEAEQVPLDELISNYEEGTRLYQICEKQLDEAQGRIEAIRKKKDGSIKLEPLHQTDETNEDSTKNVTKDVEIEPEFEDGELF